VIQGIFVVKAFDDEEPPPPERVELSRLKRGVRFRVIWAGAICADRRAAIAGPVAVAVRPLALEEPRKLDTKVFSDAQVPISALRDGPDGRVAFCLAGEEEIVPCKETDGAKRGFFESVFGAR
jgi:hypothetical protein